MSDTSPIDFLKLRREEKRKAKQKLKDSILASYTKAPAAEETNSTEVISAQQLAADTSKPGDEVSHPESSVSHDSKVVQVHEGLHWTVPTENHSYIPTLISPDHKVGRIPSVYYFARFLPEAFINLTLMPFLRDCPSLGFAPPPGNPEEEYRQSLGKWRQLVHARRRVMLLDSTIQPFPEPIHAIVQLLITTGVCRAQGIAPNHVLINEYYAGEGILPHTDGPEYFPQTATISVGGSDVLLKFSPRLETHEIGLKSQQPEMELLLEGHGSLVLFRDDAYIDYCHSIDETQQETTSNICANAPTGILIERGHRISLTFRTRRTLNNSKRR